MSKPVECIDIEEAAGKIVKAIVQSYSDDNLLMVFTDGSLIQFYSESEDEDACISTRTRFEPDDFPWQALEEAIGGRYPEIVAARKEKVLARLVESQKNNEAEERAQYERLRRKFEIEK